MDNNTSIQSSSNNQKHAFYWTGELDQNFWGHIMEEIYKSQIYKPYLPAKKEGSVVLEIGANVGLVTEYFSRHFEKVIALEPSSETFENLSLLVKGGMVTENETGKFIELPPLSNVTIVKKALFIENGEFMFGGPDNNKTMKSLHMATWQDGKPEEKVETITCDKLFEDYKIEHVNLMKIDIEGSEIEVLSSLGFKNVADKIDIIVGESHQWAGRHPNQLKEALKFNGFTLTMLPKTNLQDADVWVATKYA